jgi:hypothetical protein
MRAAYASGRGTAGSVGTSRAVAQKAWIRSSEPEPTAELSAETKSFVAA